jgi:hypothetical protein
MHSKKAAKKVSRKADHGSQHDLRRAYEHLGRIDILEGALAGAHFVQVSALATLAQQHLALGHAQDAAELLCAAEHICFAALAPDERPGALPLVSAELKNAIAAELNDLTRSAEARWTDPSADEDEAGEAIAAIYTAALSQSHTEFARGAFRPALELARAAEALTHVDARFAGLEVDARRMAS